MLSQLKKLLLFITILPIELLAQDTNIFKLREFISVVQKFHPISKQAEIVPNIAKQFYLSSYGAFDPQIMLSTNNKEFKSTEYYDYREAFMQIPTWYGVDFLAGIEQNNGARINPDLTPGQTQYLGIKIPLLQGLTMDSRRNAVLQSKQMLLLSDAEKLKILNQLFYEAILAYFQWKYALDQKILLDSILITQINRFEWVKQAFNTGERPAIDTMEALTQILQFSKYQTEAVQLLNQSRIELSNFLWTPSEQYYLLPDNIIPETNLAVLNEFPELENQLKLSNEHPELIMSNTKLRMLQIDRKYKFQLLLPKLDLSYKALADNFQFINSQSSLFQQSNIGLNFQLPILLREARGNLNRVKLEIKNQEWQIQTIRATVENNIRRYYNDFVNYKNQLNIQTDAVKSYKTLSIAETNRFILGESSLFLVNQRENKYLESEIEKIKLELLFAKSLFAVKYASADIFSMFSK